MPYVPTPKKIKKSIKLDRVNPTDFMTKNITYCCEQCSHFNPENETCTIGYWSKQHKKSTQMQRYLSTGHMAFCRFSEID
jgi:hypothetical protein